MLDLDSASGDGGAGSVTKNTQESSQLLLRASSEVRQGQARPAEEIHTHSPTQGGLLPHLQDVLGGLGHSDCPGIPGEHRKARNSFHWFLLQNPSGSCQVVTGKTKPQIQGSRGRLRAVVQDKVQIGVGESEASTPLSQRLHKSIIELSKCRWYRYELEIDSS